MSFLGESTTFFFIKTSIWWFGWWTFEDSSIHNIFIVVLNESWRIQHHHAWCSINLIIRTIVLFNSLVDSIYTRNYMIKSFFAFQGVKNIT
jgi:hypothetical protein